MNVKLLKKIKQTILRRPKQFYMNMWFETDEREYSHCGTAACIAGWAYTIGGDHKKSKTFSPKVAMLTLTDRSHIGNFGFGASKLREEATRLLEINDEQALRLFFTHMWPDQFRCADHLMTNAENAAKRIDHFIATEGRE